jgi:hypothetical protein
MDRCAQQEQAASPVGMQEISVEKPATIMGRASHQDLASPGEEGIDQS